MQSRMRLFGVYTVEALSRTLTSRGLWLIFTVLIHSGGPNIIDLTVMDVPDQYIWSKSNFKKKMCEFRIYFNNFICCVFGVQPFQLE